MIIKYNQSYTFVYYGKIKDIRDLRMLNYWKLIVDDRSIMRLK